MLKVDAPIMMGSTAKSLMKKTQTRFKLGTTILGRIGQSVAETVTGGSPRSFPEPPSKTRLRADIYIHDKDEVVEVKTGRSKVREYQIERYQRKKFRGGFSVMYVQNPFTGEIGPDPGDYIILAARRIPYTQVRFTCLWPMPRDGKALVARVRVKPTQPSGPFMYQSLKKRGLREMVVLLLHHSAMNGPEIINGVESMTEGKWRPTAGSLYPLLLTMMGEHTVSRRVPDDKYELTPYARREITTNFGSPTNLPQKVDEAVTEMHSFVSYMEDVKASGKEDLEPHQGKLKGLAKRLSELAGRDEDKTNQP